MTEKEAARRTKYFGAGVHVHIWCYRDAGNWGLSVRRDGASLFYVSLDPLLRRIQQLRAEIASGDQSPRLFSEKPEYPEDELNFNDADDAWECVDEIVKGITHIQANTSDPRWFPIPADLLDRPVAASAITGLR